MPGVCASKTSATWPVPFSHWASGVPCRRSRLFPHTPAVLLSTCGRTFGAGVEFPQEAGIFHGPVCRQGGECNPRGLRPPRRPDRERNAGSRRRVAARHTACSSKQAALHEHSQEDAMTPTRGRIEKLVMQIQNAFLENPTLSLTLPAAQWRFGADEATCAGVLDMLVDARVLARRRRSDGGPRAPDHERTRIGPLPGRSRERRVRGPRRAAQVPGPDRRSATRSLFLTALISAVAASFGGPPW